MSTTWARRVFAAGLGALVAVSLSMSWSGSSPRAGALDGGPLQAADEAELDTAALAAATSTAGFHPVAPVRIADTRRGGRVTPTTPLTVKLGDDLSDKVGPAATAVLVNLTAVDATGAGYLTAYACGAPVPQASNVNYSAAHVVAGAATVSVGAGRELCVFSSAPAHVVIDLNGWFGPDGHGLLATPSVRLLDTRASGRRGDRTYQVSVSGTKDVAADAVAAVVNLTAVNPSDAGYVTAYPCGSSIPNASSVNYRAGQTVANTATVALGAGAVCVVTSTAVDLLVDLQGAYAPSGAGRPVEGLAPRRLLDTRTSALVEAGKTVTIDVPVGLASAFTVIATEGRGSGFLTVHPCDSPRPATSNVNFAKGHSAANTAVVGSLARSVCVYASAATHVVVDLNTLYADASMAPGAVAVRWATTQVGASYAAINPYRFGSSKYGKPWDCPDGQPTCTRVDMHGIARTIAAGTFAYDCSGLAVAAWLAAGVDLVKQNAAWTDPMFQNLPRVERGKAQAGDLVLFNSPGASSLTDHVGLFIDDARMIQSGTCPNGSGVCVRTINWSRVVAIVRPRY